MDVKAALMRKIGPLPVVAWAAVIGGGILLATYLRGGGSPNSATTLTLADGFDPNAVNDTLTAGAGGTAGTSGGTVGGAPGAAGGSCGPRPAIWTPPGFQYVCQDGTWSLAPIPGWTDPVGRLLGPPGSTDASGRPVPTAGSRGIRLASAPIETATQALGTTIDAVAETPRILVGVGATYGGFPSGAVGGGGTGGHRIVPVYGGGASGGASGGFSGIHPRLNRERAAAGLAVANRAISARATSAVVQTRTAFRSAIPTQAAPKTTTAVPTTQK